jgi:predicted phosphodiesterase
MKICIVSDSHDRGPMLTAAVEEAKSLGAEAVLHCGDVIGPNTRHGLHRRLSRALSDLVCCGHSHKPEIAQQPNVRGGESWLVNPGTVAGLGAPAATWVLGDLATMEFAIRPLAMPVV